MQPDILIAPYDSGSRYCGASRSLASWRRLTEGYALVTEIGRELSTSTPLFVEGWARDAALGHRAPLLLGSDHSLSFGAVRGLVSFYGPLTILHFDAHHDAYKRTDLNHYTVFYHLCRMLPVTVVPAGYRFDAYSDPIPEAMITGNTYISLDVDYFSPSDIPSVTAPVATASPVSIDQFRSALNKATGAIVGADIVEWCGATNARERDFVKAVLDCLLDKLCSSALDRVDFTT